MQGPWQLTQRLLQKILVSSWNMELLSQETSLSVAWNKSPSLTWELSLEGPKRSPWTDAQTSVRTILDVVVWALCVFCSLLRARSGLWQSCRSVLFRRARSQDGHCIFPQACWGPIMGNKTWNIPKGLWSSGEALACMQLTIRQARK